ncbi:MAG TPA: hypothetical protein VG826_35055 [Pirellulales bacterium]|nr:hypothetical protein [Pirellulales bacterium]
MTSPLRRKHPTTASVWRSSTDVRAAALAAGLFIVSAFGLNLPRAAADSHDSSKPTGPAGWSARTQKPRAAASRPASPALKWRGQAAYQEPARSGPHHAKPIPEASAAKAQSRKGAGLQNGSRAASGPALAAPNVNRAFHEVDPEATDEIRLTSLTAPADDPAADPFQEEITDEEEMADEGNADEAEYGDESLEGTAEQDEEYQADMDFDAAELARRNVIEDGQEPDDLNPLAQQPEEPEFDFRSQLPSLGEAYAQAGPNAPERCPSPRDLKPINQIDHRIAAEPGLFPQECALSEEPFQPRRFTPVEFTWKASCLAYKPLYFQQPGLERYGHTFGPVLTPIISAGHFFVMLPCLPYSMGLAPPWECEYALGWYRPGDCAPYTLGPVPLSARAAATQGVITTGLWFLFP